MNKKAITGIFLGTFMLIGGLIWLGRPDVEQNEQMSSDAVLNSLKLEEALFDFGTISMANGNVSHDFKVTNDSDQPVTLKKIYTSCMCTSVELYFSQKTYGPFGMEGMSLNSTNVTLNPGDTATIKAIYDPNAHGPAGVGQIDRLIYLADKNGSQMQLEIKATVTP